MDNTEVILKDKTTPRTRQLVTIKEASCWASDFLKRSISESNISYLVQYGKIRKHNGGNSVFVDVNDLKKYYDSYRGQREINWKKRLVGIRGRWCGPLIYFHII